MKRRLTLLLIAAAGLVIVFGLDRLYRSGLHADFVLFLIWGLGILLLINILFIVNRVWTRTNWLSRAVREKTVELREGERRYRSLVEQAGDGIFILDAGGRHIQEVNSSGEKMLGYESGELAGRHASRLFIRSQDGNGSLNLEKLERGDTASQRCLLRRKDGNSLLVDVNAKRLEDGRVLAIARDVSERLEAEGALRRREATLQAVSFSAQQFLRSGTWKAQMQDVLARLGQAIDVSRVYIFENEMDEDGNLIGRHRYEWTAVGVTSEMDNPDLAGMPYQAGGFGRWQDVLSQGGTIHGHLKDFPPQEREFLAQQDILSAAVVPIFVGDDVWWGFMGFDDCARQRDWSPAELEALRAAADTLGAAIQRERSEAELHQSVARAEALVRTASRLNEQVDHRAVLDAICEEAVRVLAVPSAAILLYEEDEAQFRIAADVGLPEQFRRDAAPLSLDVLRQYVGPADTPVVLPDVQSLPPSPLTRLLGRHDFRTLAAVELIYHDRLLGLLVTGAFGKTQSFNEEDLHLLGGLADQAAQAIANANLFTTTRRLLRRTQQQRQQMQRIIDAVPEGVVLLGAGYRILLANPAGREYLSLLTDEQVGDVLGHLSDVGIEELLAETGKGKPWYELQLDHGERILELTERPIEGKADPAGWILVIRDVTEERRRQQFLQSQERLATVGQLAAGIAHDFNNIMAIITLYSQALERNPDFPKRDEYLATISKQAGHAATLIGQILDFSRRTVMEQGRLDLLPFVKEVVKLLRRTLPESIVIQLEADEGQYFVNADPTRLQQALMNLALNARDAMPDGGNLQISLMAMALRPGEKGPVPEMAPGEWMCLSVSDTGTGISSDHLSHVFEPFFTTKQPGKGTGLGLAQVYGIVKQHGGEIEVDSKPDQGARFSIYLPALETEMSQSQFAGDQREATAAGQETVLLVEDHEPTQEAILDTLEMLGYNVLVAGNGRSALELFDQNKGVVDLVLSDMVMPEMGGLELYQSMMSQHSDVKMMVMTGYPLEDQGRSLLEQGIVDWIRKPFSPDMLGTKLRQVLEGENGSE